MYLCAAVWSWVGPAFSSLRFSSPTILLSFVSGYAPTHQSCSDVLTSGLRPLFDRHLVSTFHISREVSWSTNEGRMSKRETVSPSHKWQTTGLVTMENAPWRCTWEKHDQFHRKSCLLTLHHLDQWYSLVSHSRDIKRNFPLTPQTNKQTNSVAFSPRANYTDWSTATCRRNLVSTFVDRGVSRGQRGGSPMVVNLSFLDRSR
jgi:hypothetical protein